MLLIRVLRKIYIVIKRVYYLMFNRNISIGKGLNFRRNFIINIAKTGKIIIGDNVFFNNEVSINVHNHISIGNDCIFGENVKIYDHNHVFSDCETPINMQGFKSAPISIGSGCWIGSNVVILPGCRIGDNTIIGAGCVISGDIKSNMIVTAMNRELRIVRRKQKNEK